MRTRLLALGIFGLLVASAFFPRNAVVFLGMIAVAVASRIVFGNRNGIVLALLAPAGPLLIFSFDFPGAVAVVVLTVAGGLSFWCMHDIQERAKGAPVHTGRFELFVFAALFSFFASTFVGVLTLAVSPSVLLVAVMTSGAFAILALRPAAERARAVSGDRPALWRDGVMSGFLLAQCFVALSFLPLSPLTLAGALTILAWVMNRALLAIRMGALTTAETVRIGFLAFAVFVVLFFAVPWFSFS